MRAVFVLLLVLAGSAAAQPKLTKQPKLLQAVAPEYPPAALAAGKMAKVKVRIAIDASGLVTNVSVVDAVGDGFDEAAIVAAQQYVFEPAEFDGKPGPITVETTINFVIEERPEPEEPPPVATPRAGPPNHAGNADLPVTLSAVVVERGTRRKLPGVIVSIAGLDAVSGEDGSVHFHGVTPGTYEVLAIDAKYDRLARKITLAKRETVEIRLWMRPRGGNPYETVVEGERENLEVTRRTLQRQQLTSVPGTFGDALRVIQTLPGINRTPFGLGLLLVRGSNPDDSGIFVDGHEVPGLYHFLGGPSIFNAEMLESIDLYPGGFPARFGRKHGGVVALELRPTKSDGVHGSAKVDFLDAGGYVRSPITKDLSFAFAGRRSYIDAFLQFVLPDPGEGARRIVTPVYYDYAARLDYNLHENGRLSLFTIGSSDTLHVLDEKADTTSLNLDTAIKFLRVIATYERSLGGDLKLTLSPAFGRDRLTYSGEQAQASGPYTSLAVINNTLSYRLRVHGRIDKRLTLDSGLDMLSRATRYDALLPIGDNLYNPMGVDLPPSLVYRGAVIVGAGIYADLGIDLTARWKLVASLRGDAYLVEGQDRFSIDPRIVGKYKLSPTLTLKGYVGEFSQPPQPEFLDRRFGNPDIGLESGTQFGLGYEWKPSKLWSVDSEIYYVRRRGLVAFQRRPGQNDNDGVDFTNELQDVGVSNTLGFEIMIKREISERAFGWLSYTFSHAREHLRDTDPWTPTLFDQTHVMNIVASYKPGKGFELGARFQLATGRPETPIVGASYDADTGKYDPVQGPYRSIRVPTYRQIDVRVEKVWLYNTWSLGLYLDVINVANIQNVEATQYDYRFRESSPITSFPILPTLGIRGTW
jgi:TonB family protein